MTIAAEAEPELVPTSHHITAPFRIEITSDLARVESAWRAFEGSAWATPFQRFDWVSAYMRSSDAAGDTRVALVHDDADRLRLVLPLSISRRLGCRIGAPIGGKHASYALPLVARPGTLPDADELGAMLAAIGRELRLDAVVFPDTPAVWSGRQNPLARWGMPGANPAYRLTLGADGEETLRRAVSKDGRKKLRSKDRGLSALGRVTFARADGDDAVERALAVFLRQKRERFTQQGIRDPFMDDSVRRFLRAAARPALPGGMAAIELYTLSLDDRILAVFGAAVDGRALSGMFVSFEASHETARFSPGELLLTHVIRDCCERGFTGFDLGVGDARFKRTFCNEDVALLDAIVPLTAAGRVYASVRRAGVDLKRRLKASPTGMRLLGALRRARTDRAATAA